jgi:glycerophosphoryl diester phosphodiesterase
MLPDERAARFREEGMPVVAWTVREPAQWDAVKDYCDNLIFEGYEA